MFIRFLLIYVVAGDVKVQNNRITQIKLITFTKASGEIRIAFRNDLPEWKRKKHHRIAAVVFLPLQFAYNVVSVAAIPILYVIDIYLLFNSAKAV